VLGDVEAFAFGLDIGAQAASLRELSSQN
jgi:hypothetical protein